MSWLDLHKLSEQAAAEAEQVLARGDRKTANTLFAKAADYEEKALAALDPTKARTRGITAVSAAALAFKAGDDFRAERIASVWLADRTLPGFARHGLRDLLQAIWQKDHAAPASPQTNDPAPDGRAALPNRGQWIRVDGELLAIESATPTDTGVDLVVRRPRGELVDRSLTWEQLAASVIPENDGHGSAPRALAGLWGRWMQCTAPRMRSAALATRPLKPFAHQDEAVFDQMLPQPRLRFLLADEPGTGKTIMTGMYLVEARRRGLIPGASIIVVPAHLVPKWQEELEDYFGIQSSRLTPEIARDPRDLDPRVEVWVTSLDLYAHNPEVKRKLTSQNASWSLAVFDEAHRLTPSSRYLPAAQDLARRSHHLLLLTATPHRGKEHFFRGLCNLLDPVLYPWVAGMEQEGRLKPSRLSFLRRMKEGLRDFDGQPLFPPRYAETIPVDLDQIELAAYDAVMKYAESWYGQNATLALSIYGKRAASSLPAVEATLRRRQEMLSGAAVRRGLGQIPEVLAEALNGDRPLSEGFTDPQDFVKAEEYIVGAVTRDRTAELVDVREVLRQVRNAIELGTPGKWAAAERITAKHGIRPGEGQLLVFTEFADTARWLAGLYDASGFSVETLEGSVNHRERHRLQQRFLSREFQVLVSTDAGGEGINLQSAHVMIDWDIPWSLVRLEQRMGRLHRIGQKKAVHIYHLVARATREGRVQEVMLENLEAAAASLGGQIFDLLDATVAQTSSDFDFARALSDAQKNPGTEIVVPDVNSLRRAGELLVNEGKHLRATVDEAAAAARFRADRLEAINPVIVDGFVDALAAAESWKLTLGPTQGIRRLQTRSHSLPHSLGGGTTMYVTSDGEAIRQARAEGSVDLDKVVVLGPTEDAFKGLIDFAIEIGRPEILRGSRLIDTGSLIDYMLFVYEAELRIHDGIRQVPLPTPILIRWSEDGVSEVSWESLMSLKPASEWAEAMPTPAQIADAEAEAKAALQREVKRQHAERLGWVEKAREQLRELEDSFLEETAFLPSEERIVRNRSFDVLKNERLQQLNTLEEVLPTAVRLLGWAQVGAGVTPDKLGHEPGSKNTAVTKVISELAEQNYTFDNCPSVGVGYDLLALHRETGDQRCIVVKGFSRESGAVWLEQAEWAQALQRRADYWLYIVEHCATKPTVTVRVQNPAERFGEGVEKIQRVQITQSRLKPFRSTY